MGQKGLFGQKGVKKGSKIGHFLDTLKNRVFCKNQLKSLLILRKRVKKGVQKWVKNGSKMGQKWVKNDPFFTPLLSKLVGLKP